jgi:hypothetical protein
MCQAHPQANASADLEQSVGVYNVTPGDVDQKRSWLQMRV